MKKQKGGETSKYTGCVFKENPLSVFVYMCKSTLHIVF